MVCCDQRLAFAAVDEHIVDGFARFEFDVGRESGSAHSGYAFILYDLDDLVCSEFFEALCRLYGIIKYVFSV